MQIVKILLPIPKLFPLYYLVPAGLKLDIGDLIVAPFRNKTYTGIVWEINCTIDQKLKLKTIDKKVLGEFKLIPEMLSFIKKAGDYYLSELGSIAKLVVPVDIAELPFKIKKQEIPPSFNLSNLSATQQEILLSIEKTDKPALIHGVTGSGKTEIYFHLIDKYLRQGKQILVMLPEIALSTHIIQRFINKFGFEPVIWNSTITKAQKKMSLRAILNGEVKIVIGARSGLFLPYINLGLIIVDEEHDASYKQEEGVLYNARDMAILRGALSNTKIILCSATPAIETIHNVNIGKYQLFKLTDRYLGASLPDVKIVDMRAEKQSGKNSVLSSDLITAIRQNLEKKEQTLLFLNRKGYAPLMICRSCGYRSACPSCSAWLVAHKNTNRLECHHCGYRKKIYSSCPQCLKEDSLIFYGIGIERVEEEIQYYFSGNKIATISKDGTVQTNKMQEFLHKMENGEIDILIGTQIITKGYHFPKLTLVGIIDPDMGLIGGDLRAGERTWQLLQQVGGRAGREDKKGVVLLQTYYPEHAIFNMLKNGKNDEFTEYELQNRKESTMPPFTKMASIVLTGKNERAICDYAKKLVAQAPESNARILGPARATLAKLAGNYRYRILVIVDKKFNLQLYLKSWFDLVKLPSNCLIRIDIDPQNL